MIAAGMSPPNAPRLSPLVVFSRVVGVHVTSDYAISTYFLSNNTINAKFLSNDAIVT